MYIPSSYGEAILCCLITMVCWGSWANAERLAADKSTDKLTDKWRFELFYWDYAIGILLTTTVLGFSLGTVGSVGRHFLADLTQSNPETFFLAFTSGVLVNIANILLVTANSIAGMQVALPLFVVIGLIVGVVLNYTASPVGHPLLLFAGIALFIFAIWLESQAYQRIHPRRFQPPITGIVCAVTSGALFGLFYRVLALATAQHFSQPEIGRMGPYASAFSFGLGIFLSSFVFIPNLMERPISGTPVTSDDYFDGQLRDHLIGVLGGSIWCIGLEFSVLAAERIGFAISFGLAQGAMLVSALWSIFLWEEYRDATKDTHAMLMTMVGAYTLGIVSFALARIYA